jgi:outer membrane immunogenic protein
LSFCSSVTTENSIVAVAEMPHPGTSFRSRAFVDDIATDAPQRLQLQILLGDHMKRILFAVASLLIATSVSSAADLGRGPYSMPIAQPVFNWTGFYLGVNGGYGWADNDVSGIGGLGQLKGGFVGGQLGYNLQIPSNWVFGVEADAHWADMTRTDVATVGGAVFSLKQQFENFGTFRGRVGYAVNNVMFYGTGGWAWANQVDTASVSVPGFFAAASISNFMSGYAAGAGIEWAFYPNASIKVEYLHLGFDTNNYLGVLPVQTNVDTVRVGLNYAFH